MKGLHDGRVVASCLSKIDFEGVVDFYKIYMLRKRLAIFLRFKLNTLLRLLVQLVTTRSYSNIFAIIWRGLILYFKILYCCNRNFYHALARFFLKTRIIGIALSTISIVLGIVALLVVIYYLAFGLFVLQQIFLLLVVKFLHLLYPLLSSQAFFMNTLVWPTSPDSWFSISLLDTTRTPDDWQDYSGLTQLY